MGGSVGNARPNHELDEKIFDTTANVDFMLHSRSCRSVFDAA